MKKYDDRGSFEAGFGMISLIVIVLIVLFVVGASIANYINPQTQVCTVEDKDRVANSDGKSNMRIYTEECGVLEVSDLFFAGQFNAADIYNDLDEGGTYHITTTGYRVPFFSMFPIVREVEPA